jgi:hypothetical protein
MLAPHPLAVPAGAGFLPLPYNTGSAGPVAAPGRRLRAGRRPWRRCRRGRWDRRLHADGPHYFGDLAGTSEAEEQAAIDAGQIRAGGIRSVASRP